jgi:hypothetical protein
MWHISELGTPKHWKEQKVARTNIFAPQQPAAHRQQSSNMGGCLSSGIAG